MNEPVKTSDIVTAAHRLFDEGVADLARSSTTGSVTITAHIRDGKPNGPPTLELKKVGRVNGGGKQ